MTSDLLYHLVDFILIEVYVNVERQHEFDLIQLELDLKQFSYHLNNLIVEYQFYEFKQYNPTDFIDDEQLCANFLAFSALFEDFQAPAILMKLILSNDTVEVIKLDHETIKENSNNLTSELLFQLTCIISRFFN